MAKKAKKRKPKQATASALGEVITAAEKVTLLSDVFLVVKRKRFEIDQSGVALTDDQRRQLNAEYDVARDAYYKGLSEFIDATEPSVRKVIDQIGEARTSLESIEVRLENTGRLLGAISSIVGLASKLVVLGAL